MFAENVTSVTGVGISRDTQSIGNCACLALVLADLCKRVLLNLLRESVHVYIPSARWEQVLLFPRPIVAKMPCTLQIWLRKGFALQS